jgi:RNA polymerase sigma-70 factor (ECF subfamily)
MHANLLDDEHLVAAALHDPDAFGVLYQRYQPLLYQFFYQQLGNSHDAEDMAATTLAKALGSLDRYQEQGRFAAWLFSIARHTLQDARRRKRPQVNLDLLAPTLADPALSPEALIVRDEQARTLRRLLRRLPDDQRLAILLRFFDDHSTDEAAALLGRSAGAIKMLVHRAITSLREQWEAALLVRQPALIAVPRRIR